MPSSSYAPASIDAAGAAVRETVSLALAIGGLVDDADRRWRLRGEIAGFVAQSDELLSRWAAVMLNVDMYAEAIDRYVELAGDLAWLGSLLDRYESPAGHLSRREFRTHPPMPVSGEIDKRRVVDALVSITQLAERLDQGTLELALRLVPLDWWATQLVTTTEQADHPARPRQRWWHRR